VRETAGKIPEKLLIARDRRFVAGFDRARTTSRPLSGIFLARLSIRRFDPAFSRYGRDSGCGLARSLAARRSQVAAFGRLANNGRSDKCSLRPGDNATSQRRNDKNASQR